MTISQTCCPNNNGTIYLFELTNLKGTIVKITNAGAVITSIKTADKKGNFDEITLGFDNPGFYISNAYLSNCPYLGATAGRFANRIDHGKFSLLGKEYNLAVNNGNHHLHGGPTGFHSKIWEAVISGEEGNQKLVLTLNSPDMDEGYPGNLKVSITYNLTENNELIMEYQANTDKATPVNLTNHTYFNLSGLNENILNHEVMIFADAYTEKNDDIPTGEITPVKETPYDFRTFRKIGEKLNLLPTDAYDHNFVLNAEKDILTRAAIARDTQTGRVLEVFTTMPGMQFYSGYHLDGSYERNGKKFESFSGFCMETQFFPDSPNKPNFPDCITTPEKPFKQTTVFKFGINN